MNWIYFAIAGSVAQLIDGALGMGFGLTSSTVHGLPKALKANYLINKIVWMLFFIGSISYCIYLIFIFSDSYIILEVKSYKYSINDYILVSMTLYTDVIMIIFFLLSKTCDGKLEKKQN